jgi:hypothetical protein
MVHQVCRRLRHAPGAACGEHSGDGVRAGGVELPLSDAQRSAIGGSRSLLYGLRPESVTLADRGMAGKVIMVEPTGPETYALIDTAFGHLLARAPGRLGQRSGDAVHLAWRPEDAHLFDATSELRIAQSAAAGRGREPRCRYPLSRQSSPHLRRGRARTPDSRVRFEGVLALPLPPMGHVGMDSMPRCRNIS